ncbi:YbaK/EbsC family protein [Solitalea sp. MAHUQ-68]|uniref:YbaK/EbsC family protein n=1 Tax=Solitalea agri TaxID=2953739 RepID=A0A9X2JB14_9SPHI|nr:YbaK/EbsC family protein [Solitalea agri]MCO4291997.1 YbaK/EbsC family protein [Solitalea agri]
MHSKKLEDYLNDQNVQYAIIDHMATATAQRTAAAAHIPGNEMAKTVMLKVDDKMMMAVLPCHCRIDIGRLKEITGANNISLANEGEFRTYFPDCETGAMPPFGNLYGMDVLVDEQLSKDQKIAFNSGSHRELIQMPFKAFENLVHPRISHFTA